MGGVARGQKDVLGKGRYKKSFSIWEEKNPFNGGLTVLGKSGVIYSLKIH